MKRQQLIDGIGPPSASMLDSANLELTTFVAPELTWKTVKKGFRSASRRPRKPAKTMNAVGQQDDKSSKMGELSVSESEKIGATVLGRRFAEKIEPIPIKKRRFPLQSPSTPPQIPSPHRDESLSSQPWTSSPQPEDFDQTIPNKRVSAQWCCSDSVSIQGTDNALVNGELSGLANKKVGNTEDLSGIALLAAAACNNSISYDAHNVKEGPIVDHSLITEGTGSSISATTLERTTTSSESGNLFVKESADEDNVDVSMIQDNSRAISHNSHDKGDSEAGRRSSSMKDDRLHWDLNTVMEEWELPCDDLDVGGSETIPDDGLHCENPVNGLHCENPVKLEDCVRYRDTKHVLESFPELKPIKSRPLSEEKTSASPTSVIMETREASCEVSALQLGQKVSIDNVPLVKHELDQAVSDKVVCDSGSIQSEEVSRKAFHLPGNRTSQTELVSTITCQMPDVEYSGKSGPSNSLSERENSSELGTTFGEGQPVVAVDVKEKQDKEAPTADASLMDSLLHVKLNECIPNSYECFGKVVLEDPTYDGYSSDVSHSGHGRTVRDEKMNQIQVGYESPFEDGELRESDVYPCAENEVEGDTECVDYDSDYGDGDGDGDGDEFNAANQCMSDVGSDSCLKDNNGSLQEKSLQCGRSDSLKESSHSTSLNKFTGQNQLPEGRECSNERTSEANDRSTQNYGATEFIHGLEVEGSSAGEVGSRETRERLISHIEEPSCSDALQRKDHVCIERNSYDSCLKAGRMLGSEKYFKRDRPSLPMRGRNQRDGHTGDSPAGYWNSRNHNQTGYAQGTGHPRPRSNITNSAAKIDGLTFRDQRRYTDYASKGVYRPFIRRRSPDDSDDAYSAPRRMVAARDNSNHIRGRGRSGIHRQGFSRVPRETYDGPMSDNPTSSSVRLPHYLSGRERSFSPVLGRGISFSRLRRKSRSRSRSRSPLPWHLERERDMGVRRLSRSPDFRSEARMGRVRMPFQKSNYATDDVDAFKSPPSSRFSPERPSRWIDDQNCGTANFMDRKPPGRFFGGSQKFDSGGSHGRIRSDDCFRPMTRPGRFTEHSVGGGREQKYDGGNWERERPSRWIDDQNCGTANFMDRKPPGRFFGGSQKFDSGGSQGRIRSDDCFRPVTRPGRFTEHSGGGGREHKYDGGNWERTKYRDKYDEPIEEIHGLRRCNTGGVTRRFRRDDEDCFDVQNTRSDGSCIKGSDRRDTPRGAREERGPFRYNDERMYGSGP